MGVEGHGLDVDPGAASRGCRAPLDTGAEKLPASTEKFRRPRSVA